MLEESLMIDGLRLTGFGLGLVFLGLGGLWGLIALLMRVLPEQDAADAETLALEAEADAIEAAEAEELTAERAEVAAIVAGAFLSNALPLMLEPPPGPTFEHGRTAPSWVTANRARTLGSWQPKRSSEL